MAHGREKGEYMKSELTQIEDSELLTQLEALSKKENEATVDVLLHLAEVERRQLYLAAGYSSLFSYCTGSRLRYSEPAASRRVSCARAVAKFPELTQLLLTKELSLTTLSLASGILCEENKQEVIAGILRRSRREVESFVARYHPRQKQIREQTKPVIVVTSDSRTKKVRQRKPSENNTEAVLSLFSQELSAKDCAPDEPGKVDISEAKTEERYELRFSVSAEVMRKLEEAKSLLSGKYPQGVGLEGVLGEALEALLDKRSPKRRAKRRAKRTEKLAARKTTEAAEQKKAARTRHIPQEIRDQVYLRDNACCAFVAGDGTKCGETHDLEVHHIKPVAKNGTHELANLSLRCRRHNMHEAGQDYGQACMARIVGHKQNTFHPSPNPASGVW
jgi:5-methylcytosine-specific restriction endonuclease McrA